MLRFADPGGRMYGAVGAANVNILAHWTTVNTNNGTWSVSAGNGRAGGACLRFSNALNGNNTLVKTLTSQPTYGLAMAFNMTTAVPVTALTILGFTDAGTAQVELRLNPDLTLQFTRFGTAIGAASSIALTQNTWYHIEAKVTFHNTAGSIELRVNGIPRIGPTGSLNTRNTANNSASGLYIASLGPGATSGGTWSFDDIVMWDTQPNDANGFADISDFIGDCAVSWLPADGAGVTTQFNPSAGSNFQCVDDTTPNGDTDYVEATTVGNLDTYTCANLPVGSSAVKSLAVVHYARKTDVSSRGMKAELRSNGGEATHPTEIALADTYAYYMSNFGRDPNNGSVTNWTAAAVNALEAGQKVSS